MDLMNRLTVEKRVMILRALCEGASVSATSRIVGASKVTVLKLLGDVGPICLDYQRRALVELPCTRLQCDEIWSFVHSKERNVPLDERGRGRGDAWIWVPMCVDTKLIPCWHVGQRDALAASVLMTDLASRLAHRAQLTTDGLRVYLPAVENAFGWGNIDYAMLVKIYGHPLADDDEQRYSPPQVIDAETRRVMGEPDMDDVSTSHIERQNLTMRMNMRRLTRLTNGFSKKIENHKHALSLHYMYYNFVRKHLTLTKRAGGMHKTPAMAAGVADHAWTVRDIVELLEATE